MIESATLGEPPRLTLTSDLKALLDSYWKEATTTFQEIGSRHSGQTVSEILHEQGDRANAIAARLANELCLQVGLADVERTRMSKQGLASKPLGRTV